MTGLMTISFTDDMMIPDLNLYPISDSVIQITLDSMSSELKSHSNRRTLDVSDSRFSWNVVSFEKREVLIQFSFVDPSAISQGVRLAYFLTVLEAKG